MLNSEFPQAFSNSLPKWGAYSDLHTINVYRGHKFIMDIRYTVNKHTLINYGKKGAITRQLPGQKLQINSLVQ